LRDIFWRFSRWLIAAAIVVVAAYVIWQQLIRNYGPKVASVDPALPELFRANEWVFWSWFFGLALASGFGGWWTVSRLRAWRREGPTEEEPENDLDPAWDEVVVQTAPGPKTLVYLAFATTSESVARLLQASGLSPAVVAPDAETSASLRAFQTEEGTVIWCGGRPSQTAGYVCRALKALNPDRPTLRGVLAVLPVDALRGTRGGELAATYRAAARAVAAGSEVRCPFLVVITGMQDEPGFLEFVRRMPPEFRHYSRFGFSIPARSGRSVAAAAAGYDGLKRWYGRKAVGLMADRPTDQDGNLRLLALGRSLDRLRPRLMAALEVLSAPDDEDPLELTGCYFVADGDDPEDWACAAATLQGQLVGDPDSARWSRASDEADRAGLRRAYTLAAGGAAVLCLAWACNLWGIVSPDRLTWTWLFLGLTAVGWGWTLWDWLWHSGRKPGVG